MTALPRPTGRFASLGLGYFSRDGDDARPLAENDFSQWHQGHGEQANAASKANDFALAENGFSQ